MCYIKMAQSEEATGRNYKGTPTHSATSPALWRKAIESCDKALLYDKDSVKGLYRKGIACLRLHEFEHARELLGRAASLEPANREVRHALAACRQGKADATAADAKLFQRVWPQPYQRSREATSDHAFGTPLIPLRIQYGSPSMHTASHIDERRRCHQECFGSNPLPDRAFGPTGDAPVAGAVHGSTSSAPCW
jgi:tetratricopeptide (TPR) repeat protein